MNVLVIGCGLLGRKIARTMDEMGWDVSVLSNIESDLELLENDFEGVTFRGFPMDIRNLREAGIESCDAVAVTTADDNLNITVAQIARDYFGIQNVVARVSDPARELIFEHMGLHTICPTNHAGDRIVRMLSGEKMNKKIEFGLHTVDFDVRPAERHQIGKNVGELRGNPGEVVFGIIRKSGAFVLAGLAPLKLEAGDVGESLARRILEGRRHEVRIIESDRARSLQLANALDVEIICGDGTNIDMLENAGVRDADCFIAISGDDANNLVASQLAKQYFGAKKVIARANDPRNLETMRVLGVDYAVSSTEIIAQMIEQEANLMEFHLVASLNKGRGQICSVTLGENSVLHGKSVREVVFPKGALLISIVRNNKLIIPGGDTVLQAGDEIIAVCEERAQKALIRLMNSTHADEK